MATSKTLTPTNVTIQIPEFTDQPDQRVNSNCIDKEADAINALNAQIANIPMIKYGSEADTYTAGQYKAVEVTFTGTAFTTAPKVVCQSRSTSANPADVSHVVVDSVTTSGFKFRVKNTTSNQSLGIAVDWIAVGI